MAFFLRTPNPYVNGRYDHSRAAMSSRVEGSEQVFVHSAPLVMHDSCAKREGLENHSRELRAEWDAAKDAVAADHKARGQVRLDTGEGWSIPSPDTPRELVAALNAAGRAVNDYRDPISALAGPSWQLCWSRLWTDDADTAPLCYVCGGKVVGRG